MEKLISNNFSIKGGYNDISFYFTWNNFIYITHIVFNTCINTKNRNKRSKHKQYGKKLKQYERK